MAKYVNGYSYKSISAKQLDFGLISPATPRNTIYERVSRRGRFLARRFLKGLRRKLFRKRRAN